MGKSTQKKMGGSPTFKDPGILNPANKDNALRYNPTGESGAPIPTFSEGTRFGTAPNKDPAVRFNPKKP